MKGENALHTRLQSLARLTEQAALDSANHAAEQTAAYARQTVPVRTGRLKASIMAGEEGKKRMVRVFCPYAVYVEMGTRFMAARPYLRPGVQRANYQSLAMQAWKEKLR